MKKSLFLTVVAALLLCFNINAQDKILLTNGKYKLGEVLEVNEDFTYYVKWNKYWVKGILTKDIYQIDFQDSAKVVIYEQDESEGFNLTVEEMDYYVLGQQDARTNYRAPWVTVGGMASGIVGGIGIIPPAYGLLVPATYTGIAGLGIPKAKEQMIENSDLINNNYFMSGYQYTASKKRVKNALIGGTIGFSIAVATIMLLAD